MINIDIYFDPTKGAYVNTTTASTLNAQIVTVTYNGSI